MPCTAEQARANGKKSLGRPPITRSTKRRQRTLAHAIAISGKSPIDVMFSNLCFWHEHVGRLTEEVQQMVVNAEDDDQRKEAMSTLKELLVSRRNAQDCAVDLAPYIHARFSSITFTPPAKELESNDVPLDALGASETYQRLLTSSG